jgi:hypothetical protein
VWSRGPDLPAARGAGGLAIYKDSQRDEMHYFGGGQILPGHTIGDFTTHWSLDLTAPYDEQEWVLRRPSAFARNHLGAATFGGYIYLIGGQLEEREVWANLDLIERYDPITDT